MEPWKIQEQKDFLQKSEKTLDFDSIEMARALLVDYDTYSKWRRGQRELKAAPKTSVKMLVLMKLCSETKTDAFTEWTSKI